MSPSGGQLSGAGNKGSYAFPMFQLAITFNAISIKFHLKSFLAFVTIKCPSLPLAEMC